MNSLCAGPEEVAVRRVRDHLLVQDLDSAVKEAKYFAEIYPTSSKIQKIYLESLCQKGEEIEALQQFLSMQKSAEEEKKDLKVISEWLAWGVLKKGENSPLLLIRLYALLGIALTRDVRAIPVLLKEMRGSNALLRSLAIKLTPHYGDAPLQEELCRLLNTEKVWFVRLEVIRSLGALRVVSSKEKLQAILTHPKTLAEEKSAVILALVGMSDIISHAELCELVHSDRAGLRHLGSEMIAHLNLEEEVELLIPLLQDSSPDVRISAMNTLGLLRIEKIREHQTLHYIQKNLEHTNPSIGITAAWLATILRYDEGKKRLAYWLESDRPESKRLAAAAVAASGFSGLKLAITHIKQESDPYTKVNLAMALIKQRKDVFLASQVLFDALTEVEGELWMWDNESNPLFKSLNKSTVKHVEQIPRYPQVVDQLTRLELFSVLSLVKHPKALVAVKEFLRNREWGITGAAASTLLQEGDESSLLLVRQLLEDPEEKIRLQAALLLGMFGRDPAAIQSLQNSYTSADKEMKIHILEVLGHIGDPTVLPFLLIVLQEPFQGIRVVSASALIQCLYQ